MAAILASAAIVHARPAPHHDLAGLIVQSDMVVVADRIGLAPNHPSGVPMARYRVVRVLRAASPTPAIVEVIDTHDTHGRSIDARAVLFMEWEDGAPRLLPSGLRVVADGKVYGFVQLDNPGPYRMTPQRDEDTGTGHLDFDELEHAIVMAAARVDALAVATLERDPIERRARILELLPQRPIEPWFFRDALAQRAVTALHAADDIEGALLVQLRDRGVSDHAAFASTKLRAVAHDIWADDDARGAAIEQLAVHDDFLVDLALGRGLLGLLDDVSPTVRSAAVRAIASVDPQRYVAYTRQIALKLQAEARDRLETLYRTEHDPHVLFTAASAFRTTGIARPRRSNQMASGPSVVIEAALDGSGVVVEAYCMRGSTRATQLVASLQDEPIEHEWPIALACSGRGHASIAPLYLELAAGRYTLAVELVGPIRERVAIERFVLGTLEVDGGGGQLLTR